MPQALWGWSTCGWGCRGRFGACEVCLFWRLTDTGQQDKRGTVLEPPDPQMEGVTGRVGAWERVRAEPRDIRGAHRAGNEPPRRGRRKRPGEQEGRMGWRWRPALISWLLSLNREGCLLPTPALCLKLFFFLAMETPLAPAHGKLEVLASECAWPQPSVAGKRGNGRDRPGVEAIAPSMPCRPPGALDRAGLLWRTGSSMTPLLALASQPSCLTSSSLSGISRDHPTAHPPRLLLESVSPCLLLQEPKPSQTCYEKPNK